MKVVVTPAVEQWPTILSRPVLNTDELDQAVKNILSEVQRDGDKAVHKYTERFDQVSLSNFQVSLPEIEEAKTILEEDLKVAVQTAAQNISTFHTRQQLSEEVVETMPGVRCWRRTAPVEKVGLYIPGGTAPLFSTVLMLGIPARIAGCKEIILCSPPRPDGTLHPAILFAAELVGVTKIFKVGGVQAIGAMAYGTETVPGVFKIFGPGNQYVTAAKQQVFNAGVAIDMPAGPSEVLVCADHSAVPAFVAADLLSQAEHGIDSQVVLVAFDTRFVEEVLAEINRQLTTLPRKAIAERALENSIAIVLEDRTTAAQLINSYAPEHLILSVAEAHDFAAGIINAGSVFLGNYTPESVGDYASGTNHTLPTNGYARAFSGVSLDSFVKKITFQELTPEGLANLGPVVEKMAAAEQLEAHRQAVSIRLKHHKMQPE